MRNWDILRDSVMSAESPVDFPEISSRMLPSIAGEGFLITALICKSLFTETSLKLHPQFDSMGAE